MCTGGVNAYTDGFLENGLSTDEYIALCRRVGAEPAITVALQFGTPAEIQVGRGTLAMPVIAVNGACLTGRPRLGGILQRGCQHAVGKRKSLAWLARALQR